MRSAQPASAILAVVDPFDAETEDAPPLLAGRYRLEGPLGHRVYRARDLELDEIVAVKISDGRDEARLARRVTHPYVVRIFDVGDDAGVRFLTMELVDGGTLRGALLHGRLDRARAQTFARHVTAGLAAIHAEGIVHGDLRPENVLLSRGGDAKIAEVSLARATVAAYLAPEIRSGGAPDARSDVFALGVVLHEIVTGAPPSLDTGVRAIVPDDLLLPVIRECLDREPSRRPSAAAVERALGGIPEALIPARAKPALRNAATLAEYTRVRASDHDAWHSTADDNVARYEELLTRAPDDPELLSLFAMASCRNVFMAKDRLAKARQAALRAISIAPKLAEAHAALAEASLLGNDLADAMRFANRALDLSPSLALGHGVIASTCLQVGDVEQGYARAELALSIDRRFVAVWAMAARVAGFGIDRDRQRALEAHAPPPRATEDWMPTMTRLRIALNDVPRSRESQAFLDTNDDFPVPVVRAVLRRELSLATFEQAYRTFVADPDVPMIWMMFQQMVAEVALAIGDRDVAEDAVLAADAAASHDIVWMTTSRIAALRGRPRFDAALARIAERARRVHDPAADEVTE